MTVQPTHVSLLRAHGFEVRTRRPDQSVIVETPRGVVDFDPDTGLWLPRGEAVPSRGVFKLIAWAQESGPVQP